MKKIDQIVDAYYSEEVEGLKKKAWHYVKLATFSGLSAAVVLGIVTLVIFSALLFQYNPIKNGFTLTLLLLGIPLLVLLVPTSWFFGFRYLWACKKAKEKVDSIMRESHKSEPVEMSNS